MCAGVHVRLYVLRARGHTYPGVCERGCGCACLRAVLPAGMPPPPVAGPGTPGMYQTMQWSGFAGGQCLFFGVRDRSVSGWRCVGLGPWFELEIPGSLTRSGGLSSPLPCDCQVLRLGGGRGLLVNSLPMYVPTMLKCICIMYGRSICVLIGSSCVIYENYQSRNGRNVSNYAVVGVLWRSVPVFGVRDRSVSGWRVTGWAPGLSWRFLDLGLALEAIVSAAL